jgi:type IV pilus biogenesis protein CpaD/CtpE
MPALTNYEVMLNYEQNALIESQNLHATNEHAAQVVAMETLRELKSMGITVQQYNDMTTEDWDAVQARAVARARLHPTARVDLLNASDLVSAGNLGGNFFEHGYSTIIAGMQQGDKVMFRYSG